MKTLFVLMTFLIVSFTSYSQGVLIGAGNGPLPQAMLEVRSSSKGLLIPRMTSVQRVTINSPIAGLLVYDTTANRLYRYDGAVWRYLLDDSFWKMSGDDLYNMEDSIGLGTSSPDEKLHVSGDVSLFNGDMAFTRSNGTVNKVLFNYTAGTTNGYTHGTNFYAGVTRRGFLQFRKFDAAGEDRMIFGFASPMLTLQANGTTYLNAASAILQLQTAAVSKGFLQLSGNDIRMGTNSGNNTGSFVVRTGGVDRFLVNEFGRVGVGTQPGSSELTVAGNLKGTTNLSSAGDVTSATNVEIDTDVNRSAASGFYNLVPAFYGRVEGSSAVCVCSSSSIGVSGIGSGNYFLTYPGITANDIIIVKTNHTSTFASASYEINGNRFRILTHDNSFTQGGVLNGDFSFIIFKP